MRFKIINISECFQCKHCFKLHNLHKNIDEMVCGETEMDILDPYMIPTWCPLEDYKTCSQN